MSLILDALRKMELERKAKRQNSAALRAEVLNYRGATPAPGRSRLIVAVTIGALLVAAATGLFLYRQSAPPPDNALPSPPSAATISAPPAAPAVITQPPATSPVAPLPMSRPPQPAAATRAAAVKPAAPAQDSAPPATGISISGIAWQEERSLRRAVINGSLVGEGAEIAGARVVEIRENVVRFKQGGASFEVSYPSGPGK